MYPYLQTGDNMIRDTYHSYGAGATFGFQTYIRKHLTLDVLLGIGGRYITNNREIPQGGGLLIINDKVYPFTGVDGRFSFNFGYRF